MLKLLVCLSDYDDCPNQAILQRFLDALTYANKVYLHTHPGTPALYDSGVFYREEDGREEWCDIGECIKRRGVDCEDLACWRAAELQRQGVAAKAVAVCEEKTGGKVRKRFYHIVVRITRPDGVVIEEDPSAQLGMK